MYVDVPECAGLVGGNKMSGSIGVTVRPAWQGPIINIYVPPEFRDRFIRAIEGQGSISSDDLPINFEMTVLKNWTDWAFEGEVGPHVKVEVKNLNFNFEE